MKKGILFLLLAAVICSHGLAGNPTNPILFVTQVPMPDETNTRTILQTKTSCVSPIQNPLGDTISAGRGGALMIRYSNGSVRNLTGEAGYGLALANGNVSGAQGANGIAVQHPFVHWSGTKAIFSMVVGGPVSVGDATQFHWQLYEVTNLAQSHVGPAVITYVAGQPANYNNLQACYATDGRII